jgi:hypothetical protein
MKKSLEQLFWISGQHTFEHVLLASFYVYTQSRFLLILKISLWMLLIQHGLLVIASFEQCLTGQATIL